MNAERLDGAELLADRRRSLAGRVAGLLHQGLEPQLVVLESGSDPSWRVYRDRQARDCRKMGIRHRTVTLGEEADQEDLVQWLTELAQDDEVHGILIQSPLPARFDLRAAQAAIVPAKDVEGVGPTSLGLVLAGRPQFVPCTACSAFTLARHALGELKGIEAVIIGASTIVGRPLAMLLVQAAATVRLCHIDTRDLALHTRQADLLVVAAGRAGLITADLVRPGAVVIDVGINCIQDAEGNTKVVGDVAAEVWQVARAITPVPGAVGPMTTMTLLENTVSAAERRALIRCDGSHPC